MTTTMRSKTGWMVLAAVAVVGGLASGALAKSERYDLKPLIPQVFTKGSGNTWRPIQREDEPIGRRMVPDTTDEAVDSIYYALREHVAYFEWMSATGERRTEKTASDKTSMTIEAPDKTHESIKKFLIGLGKPIKLNPKAAADDLKKKAILTNEETGTITLIYLIEAFPVSVSGITIERARTSRYDVVQGLIKRIQTSVTPDDWYGRGGGEGKVQAQVSELSGRLIVTHTPAGHIEVAKKLAEWVK